jgi:uncharacterized protein (DUF4415 family)
VSDLDINAKVKQITDPRHSECRRPPNLLPSSVNPGNIRLPDDAIDTSDAPELGDWSDAKRGLFYRPVKQQLTLRLDADVIAWFKKHTTASEGYQTRINRALREYVQGQATGRRRSSRA